MSPNPETSPDPSSVPAADNGAGAGPAVDFVPVPDIAEELGLIVTQVHQLVRDRQLLSVRRGRIAVIPAGFVTDGQITKGLPGTITLLTDAGYSDEEIITWLYTPDDSLPGRAIDALRENRGTEVKRRAQALAV